ncbi:hypothetical protein [Chryseobacterium sp. 3008163]|uniref:hypothetical protein n=1 Tax=Chryseobacterium sp. 3008163 TaxID=2478663 RepID=UPI000F0C5B66|nr:hypothetical protein [Chryseobacterium sp. 3008163]AYM99816.1 hypothetical protein EAG08_05190 [Chryseobacterium sp. 3008163]
MKTIITFTFLFMCAFFNAQFLGNLAKKAQKSTERAIERKVEQKATKTTNDGMDVILNNKKQIRKTVQPPIIPRVQKGLITIQILFPEVKLFLKKNSVEMLKEISL